MWLAAAAAPGVVFLLALAALRQQRRRPAGLSAAVAVGLTLCFEAALVNVLSTFGGVTRGPVLAVHGALALVAAPPAVRRLSARRTFRISWRAAGADALAARALVLALAIPVAYSALLYVPNNWDSMTYHLARVAHWVQNRSVAPFPTSVVRQVTYPPGAEYLLLVLQVVSGSDRLANLVQLACWVVVALAAAPLARVFGAPRRIAPWAALIFAAAPMALLQASSTQNDLVASAVATGIVVACLPFLHRRPRWRASDLVIVAALVAAGALAKPTALVITTPFLLWATLAGARALAAERHGPRARLLRGVVPAVLVAAVVLGPEVARRARAGEQGEFAPFLYPPLAEWTDRALNVARGALRHTPLPNSWSAPLASARETGCTVPNSMCTEAAGRAHEDTAGNPASALLVAALLGIGLTRRRSLPARGRTVLVALAGSWLLFCLTFRDNIWIARLHLPFFGLAPLAGVALSGAVARRGALRWAAPVAGMVLASLGMRAACRNELRPVPNELGALRGLQPATYYAARPDQWSRHAPAIAAIVESGCMRLGLLIGTDSYDYPLTWRAMQRGVAVRHVLPDDEWPCVVYSERAAPTSPEGGWRRVAKAPEVYVRRAEAAAAARVAGPVER